MPAKSTSPAEQFDPAQNPGNNEAKKAVLLKALDEIQKVKFGMQSNLSSDLLAIDIKEALYHFGMITGQVTNDELLGNIFANFCIGK